MTFRSFGGRTITFGILCFEDGPIEMLIVDVEPLESELAKQVEYDMDEQG